MRPIVRPIESPDLDSLIILMKEFSEFDGTPGEIDLDVERLSEAFFGNHPQLFGLVAVCDGDIAGFLNYFYSFASFSLEPTIWVEDVFIRSEYRRKGIGHSFFSTIQNIAREKDCNCVEWLVRKDNSSGIKFYESIGAQVDEGTIYVKWKMP